jgi:hypothetical protein
MKRFVWGFAALVLMSGACHASGWTGNLTVSQAFTEGPSDFLVVYTDGGVTTPGCVAGAWIFVADSEARRGRAWATILTALTTGQKVRFWYADSCTTWSFHAASSIMLVAP